MGETEMKIFYSWQSDSPRKVGKDFIHDALAQAISQTKEAVNFTDANRDTIQLDQDTQGILGSPEIARVIFEKIAESSLIVSDVTLISGNEASKRHINSNVAIELGYALSKLTDKGVIKVMNTYFGPPTELPFDLRARRFPVQYNLSPDCGREELERARKELAGQLAKILTLYLNELAQPTNRPHAETPFIDQRGRFWNKSDPLIPPDPTRTLEPIYWAGSSLLYCRCIPTIEMPELTIPEALDLAGNLRPLCSAHGYSKVRNKWGVISFDRSRSGNMLIGATQIFRNREIWGIDLTHAEARTHGHDEDEESKRFIPVSEVQETYMRSIESMRHLAKELGYGEKYIVELGLSGAADVYLPTRDMFERLVGPIYDSEVYLRIDVTDQYPTDRIMSDFWTKLYSEVGRRPLKELLWSTTSG